ncbi:cytochrome c oxidase accessory protein CcoG [Zooshikella marina]|uniref:cytochrome c oxidase accessory protein CcoG n=1 Tax=Zooshikella ganghwensis TaxID=202772 RepID=UPI001BAED6E5|nr:cytochrome c oxidase accessory protein CcoG [Zooshikella ganghwensis]MBU2704531.1 cytochrome c oxidase accessory protein CcoG [Zooshikella ganghwensis]
MSQDNVKDREAPEMIEVVDLYQKKDKIYPRAFKGVFRNYRIIGGTLLFLLYFGAAWLSWGDRQAILFDLPERKFHILGMTFWPQDFMLLSWLLIICAFGLFFITVWAGRVWCGYACPQSVFTWVFMWVERVTEGDRNRRIKLDKAPFTSKKFLKKSAKHTLWLLIALATGFTFVGYFSPIRELIPAFFSGEASGWAYFWIAFFTLATYGNAGWMREQVCIYMCPYARFQSVMFDSNTLIVSYNPQRGEKRGPRKKGADYQQKGLGDCIDCQMCVQVCPTGIDIRDGLQYECIGCAACIDACDNIMDRMDYPKGLISYTTQNTLAGEKSTLFRPRLIGYLVALLVIIGMFSYTVTDRIPVGLEVIRDRSTLYNTTSDGYIENLYTVKVANMDNQSHQFVLNIEGLNSPVIEPKQNMLVESGLVAELTIRVKVKADAIERPNSSFVFSVQAKDDETIRTTQESRFIAPNSQ